MKSLNERMCQVGFEVGYCVNFPVLTPQEVSGWNCTLFNVVVFNNASSPISNMAIVPVTSALDGAGRTMSTDNSIYVIINPGGVMVTPSPSTMTPHPTLSTVSRSVTVALSSSTVAPEPSCIIPQSVIMELLSNNSSTALAEVQKDCALSRSITCYVVIGLVCIISILLLIINISLLLHHFIMKCVKVNDSKKMEDPTEHTSDKSEVISEEDPPKKLPIIIEPELHVTQQSEEMTKGDHAPTGLGRPGWVRQRSNKVSPTTEPESN